MAICAACKGVKRIMKTGMMGYETCKRCAGSGIENNTETKIKSFDEFVNDIKCASSVNESFESDKTSNHHANIEIEQPKKFPNIEHSYSKKSRGRPKKS